MAQVDHCLPVMNYIMLPSNAHDGSEVPIYNNLRPVYCGYSTVTYTTTEYPQYGSSVPNIPDVSESSEIDQSSPVEIAGKVKKEPKKPKKKTIFDKINRIREDLVKVSSTVY